MCSGVKYHAGQSSTKHSAVQEICKTKLVDHTSPQGGATGSHYNVFAHIPTAIMSYMYELYAMHHRTISFGYYESFLVSTSAPWEQV